MKKQEEEVMKIAEMEGDDADLFLLEKIQILETAVENIPSDAEKIEQVSERIAEKMAIIQKGDPGDKPVAGIDYPIPENGNDYILTESDKVEIAKKIQVPIIKSEKIIERTETIKEQPIVTEITKIEVKEVAVGDTPDQVIEKVNTSSLLIKKERVEGLLDAIRIGLANAVASMPATTSFFNGLRAKNLTIVGGTATQQGDTVSIALPSSGLPPTTPTGTVDSSNKIFTTTTLPTIIFYDENTAINGFGCTITGTGPYTITMNIAPQDYILYI